MRPPEGLITYLPPYVISPFRTSSWALPLGDRPRASITHISFALKQSWTSTTLTSSGVIPGLFHCELAGEYGHVKPNEIDGRAAEQVWGVGGKLLACDQDSLRFKVRSLVEEFLGDDNHGGGAIRCRTAL